MRALLFGFLLLVFGAVAVTGEEEFHRSGDGWGEKLRLSDGEFVIEGWWMDGRHSRREGKVITQEDRITLRAGADASEQRFRRLLFSNTVYLVPPAEEDRFAALQREEDWYLRMSGLDLFFHRPLRKPANQSPEPTPHTGR